MYFQNFPKIAYTFKISNTQPDQTLVVKDITQNVRFRKEVFSRVKFYDTYKIKDGDTPEIISEKIYGNPDYHWVIMLINEKYNYIDDFAKDAYVIEDTINQRYAEHRARAHHFVDANGQLTNGMCTITIGKSTIGKIRVLEGDIAVVGTSTNFTKDIHIGNKLLTKSGDVIGTVADIVDDSLLHIAEISPITYDDSYQCDLSIEPGMVITKPTKSEAVGVISGFVNSVGTPIVFGITLTNASFFVNDGVTFNKYSEDSNGNFISTTIGTATVVSVEYPPDLNLVNYQDNEYTVNEKNRELKIIPKADIDQILSEFTDLI